MTDQTLSPTPYDDAFRTLLNDCSKLILPVINEVFGEKYTGDETILFAPNEHYLNSGDSGEEKRITDTNFIVIGNTTKRYHFECESSAPGANILIRIFEYDAQIALDQNSQIIENKIIVSFPNTAILALRSTRNTPDVMRVSIQTPGGETSYDVPVLKIKSYTIDDIFEKNLLFLIPFYIFTYESRFAVIEEDEDRLAEMREDYQKIVDRLENLVNSGKLDEFSKKTITDMAERVLKSLAKKYKRIRKGVGSLMRGRVLDYEAKRILNEGIRIGRKEEIKTAIKIYREEMNMPPSEIEKKIMERFHLTKGEAEKHIAEALRAEPV